MGEGDDDCGGGEGGEDVYNGKAEPVLVSLSDSYSDEDRIFSVGNSRSSSCPVSRLLTVDFILFFLFIFILLYFSFSFNFLNLEQLGLGVISHAVTSVTT